MKVPNLRSFLSDLEQSGELLRIDREVDPDLEIAAIADRVSHAGGDANKALLFTNVKGSSVPVLINAFGSHERMLRVCGVERREDLEPLVGDFLARLEKPRKGLWDKLGALPLLGRLGRLFPVSRTTGPCQEVVHEGEDVDLFEIPILRTWPEDAGPVITFPLVFTKDPVSGARNCGMYRLQRYDKNTLGFHVHTHHTGAEHLRRTAELGREFMPVAVAVGASPATIFSAVAPLPPGVDEMLFAAFLQGHPVEMVPCRTVDLEVPATSEFVIEGFVPVDERRTEGPFGDHTGFYSLADEYGVMHVTAITHRKEPIWNCTVVGPPPQEDCYMAGAIERLFLPLQRKVMPEVLDMRLPFAGVFHNLMLLRIKKDYPGQGHKVAHTVWGLGQAMFTKVVVVFDEEGPDLLDDEALVSFLLDRLDVGSGLEFVFGPTETLDHASRSLHFGSKMCVDLTRPFPGENNGYSKSSSLNDDPDVVEEELRAVPGVEQVMVIEAGAVAVSVEKTQPSIPRVTIEKIWEVGQKKGWSSVTDRVLVFDREEQLDDPVRLLWLLLSHIDPERDIHRSGNPVHDPTLKSHPGWHPRRIGVDATSKSSTDGFERSWPAEQIHSEQLLTRVANHWEDMGFSGTCP